MKAVEEWRNAGSKAKDSHVQIVTSQTGGGGPIITGKMLAENLAKELEAEQEKATQKYKLEIERARQMQVCLPKFCLMVANCLRHKFRKQEETRPY